MRFLWTAAVFASDPVTAASLSGRLRAMCQKHYLPPSECRLSLSAMSSESSASRDADAQTSVCPGFTLTVHAAFGNLTSFSCAMVVERRAQGTVSKQRLSHWIVDAIKAAYTSSLVQCLFRIYA